MRECVFEVCVCLVMNNVWVAGLIDVGYRVSSQPEQGLCARAQTPAHSLLTSKGVVWTGSYTNTNSLSHTFSPTLSLLHTHTHAHAQTLNRSVWWRHTSALSLHTHVRKCTHTHSGTLDFLCSQTGTHRLLCYWTSGLGFGWREAWLSTPVFAAVIRGACYFEGWPEPVHTHTHTHRSTQRELSVCRGGQYT